jgi:hypothetical protein
MFTEIDKILYNNKCEVIQTSHSFIYPIFKNGSSSLYKEAAENKWKIIINYQIKNCDEIVVFLRNPYERINTGVSTYVQNCLNQNLDEKTVLWFIKNYLFLDRHYLPQIFWIINLGKYIKKDCKLIIKDINDLKIYTRFEKNKSETKKYFLEDEKLQFYIQADEYLYSKINTYITLPEFFESYKRENSYGYNYIFQYAENLLSVLSKN